MSLINKMLQDLDARGNPAAGAPDAAEIKPVAAERRGPLPGLVAACAGGTVAVAALGWFGWQHLHRPAPPAAPVAAAGPPPAPAAAPPARGMSSTITTAPVAPPVAPVVPAPAPAQFEAPVAEATALGRAVAPMEPDSEEARSTRRALAATLAARQDLPRAAHKVGPLVAREADRPAARPKDREKGTAKARAEREPAAAGRQLTASQRAEGAYRRALASMQEGRMSETTAALEEALRSDPAHEAARQTLVALLIEAGRGDEAMRQLQLGLTRDARQPALAVLLARLQIERGGNGIDTLMRTLPFVGNNPDYHAFLAGALQRQQRHREAAEQYLVAVRGAPANGVWWMGLGLSLQAEKRDGEALEAFRKARASGALTQDLAGFVDRRIQQLAH
jgi:MSHA biogenesis protein MshN